MDINKSQVNIEHLNDLCTELKILSTDIIQTYLTNTLVGYSNAGPIIKQALFKLFGTKVYIVNEYQYIYIKYNIHKNDKFNIKFVMYLLGNIPNTTIGLAEKYLDGSALWKKHISLEEAINIATSHEYINIKNFLDS